MNRSVVLVGAVTAILLLTGFLAATQLRTESRIRQILGIASTQLDEFGYRLQRAEAARRSLEQEVETLRERVTAMRRRSVEGRAGVRALNAEVDRLRAVAGFTALQGPGVVIEIRDSARPLQAGEDPNDVLVHYSDLQAVVNELWAAGAEAVAVNGQRFAAGSSIQCVGTTLLVNRRRITSPFRIEGIGDPAVLDAYLHRPDGEVAYLAAFGFPVSVTRSASLLVPPYSGPLTMPARVAH